MRNSWQCETLLFNQDCRDKICKDLIKPQKISADVFTFWSRALWCGDDALKRFPSASVSSPGDKLKQITAGALWKRSFGKAQRVNVRPLFLSVAPPQRVQDDSGSNPLPLSRTAGLMPTCLRLVPSASGQNHTHTHTHAHGSDATVRLTRVH